MAAGASFQEAQEGSALTDRVFASRIEIVAREHGSDPEALRSAAERMCRDGLVAPIALPWGRYGLARAAALADGWGEALIAARQALRESEAAGDAMIALRAAGLVAKALSVLGDPDATDARREARARIDRVAETIEDERLRASFIARPDVASVLGD
jgi:hypothetical protein